MTDFASLPLTRIYHRDELLLVGGAATTGHGFAVVADPGFKRRLPAYTRKPCSACDKPSAAPPLPSGGVFWASCWWSADTLDRGLNFTLVTNLGGGDLLGEIIGGGRHEDLLPHTILRDLFGVPFRCRGTTPIAVKRTAGRPRDLEAVAELEVLLREKAEG